MKLTAISYAANSNDHWISMIHEVINNQNKFKINIINVN